MKTILIIISLFLLTWFIQGQRIFALRKKMQLGQTRQIGWDFFPANLFVHSIGTPIS